MARHLGWKYPYRHPPPANLVERALYGLGTVFRGLGAALDEYGSMIQGSAGVKETGRARPDEGAAQWGPAARANQRAGARPAMCGSGHVA